MFFQLFDKLCSEDYCGLMLKKLDKKKERYVKLYTSTPDR